MKKLFLFFILFTFCSGNSEEIINEGYVVPEGCEGDGIGCEMLYKENANIGWQHKEFKYCEESSLTFYFENKFNLEFISLLNFQDNKFNRSAKPKELIIYGPLDEDMVYGGYVHTATLDDIKESQYIYIPEDWPELDELTILIQSGYFTPTNVDFCGIQNLQFWGYQVINE